MHSLLSRQVAKWLGHEVSLETLPENYRRLLESVDSAYAEGDTDRKMLERSMELSSRELHRTNSELRAVLAAFPDLFIWVNGEGRILDVKGGRSADVIDSPRELLGKSLFNFPNAMIGEKFKQLLEDVSREDTTHAFEYEVPGPKAPAVFEARAFPMVQVRSFVIVRNITDTRRVELAEAANREKSEFLANMSHEIRTPLHGILSFARFGCKKIDNAERSKLFEYFTHIERGGSTLLLLLNDLLDLAKLEAGHMMFDFGRIDLARILEHELDQFRSRTSEMDLTLCPRITPSALVEGDPLRLGQVLRNLIGNAVKFSPPGGRIGVECEVRSGQVCLSVFDQGAGIPEDELETIFEQFIQSSSTNNGSGGTGLGLTICREIVDAHGGRIWAANHPGGGARFQFELPEFQEDRRTTPAPLPSQSSEETKTTQ